MAEFLVKAVDATHPDPTKDLRGCYKRGDVVDVRLDGFEWGKSEGLPNFIIVKCPDINVDDARKMMGRAHLAKMDDGSAVLGNLSSFDKEAISKRNVIIGIDPKTGLELIDSRPSITAIKRSLFTVDLDSILPEEMKSGMVKCEWKRLTTLLIDHSDDLIASISAKSASIDHDAVEAIDVILAGPGKQATPIAKLSVDLPVVADVADAAIELLDGGLS